MAEPSDEKEMRMVPRETPRPRLLATAASVPAPVAPRPPKRVGRKLIALIIGTTALVALGSVTVKYREREGSPAAQRLVTPDLLHVTSVALGKMRFAIINGQQVEEGKWLKVQTPEGTAALRVMKIEDGVVHFRCGNQKIDAKLTPTSFAEKKSLR